jgi:L-ribulose-5-phosphate 3-epimerase
MTFPANFSVISDEVSQDLPDIARFVKEFKLPGIELRSMFGRAFKDLTPADIAEVKRTAQGEGWKIFGCASPVFKCDIDDAAATRAHVEEFKRSLGVAHELGAGVVRVFTFLRRTSTDTTKLLPRIAEALEQLRTVAAGSKVKIGIENEASCMVGTAAESIAICRALPNPQFGIVWDPCNVLYVPEPVVGATADFEALAPRIVHIHVKDAVRAPAKAGGLPAIAKPVGTGDVGWRAHLAQIQKVGYKGMISLETHWRVIQIAEADLHLPAGYGFSRGGEEASRVCLHNLRELLPTTS